MNVLCVSHIIMLLARLKIGFLFASADLAVQRTSDIPLIKPSSRTVPLLKVSEECQLLRKSISRDVNTIKYGYMKCFCLCVN